MDINRYTYQVAWSNEDQEFVATVLEFPSLSWLAPDRQEAENGLVDLVAENWDELCAHFGDEIFERLNGKSDTLAAENAARSVLAGFATVIPKTADSGVEMIRQLKIAHDSAVTDRSAAIISIKAMLVHADDTLRRETNRMTPIKLARHLAALRPRNLETPADALRHALRSLARRWQHLDSEAKELRASIEALVATGFRPAADFDDGLRATIDYFRHRRQAP